MPSNHQVNPPTLPPWGQANEQTNLDAGSKTSDASAPFALLNDNEQRLFRSLLLEDAYPLSGVQQKMVFANLNNPEACRYHEVISCKLQLKWQGQKFEQALTQMVKQYPSLRSTFLVKLARPLQLIHQQILLPMVVNDLVALPLLQRARLVKAWITKEKAAAFDFTQPLWQVTIHPVAEDEFYFHLSFHHALWDGATAVKLSRELFSLYKKRLKND